MLYKRIVPLLVIGLLLAACGGAPAAAPAATKAAPAAPAAGQTIVGLITKTETNPFFVKMREGADAAAKAKGMTLMTAAGAFDGDNEGQVTAIENMVNAGVKGILITPNDAKAIIPAIKKARDAGVLVIALDSPLQPQDASDALFATNNFVAGELIGKYAAAAMKGKPYREVAYRVMRPFVGSRTVSFQVFRPREGNFYEAVYNTAVNLQKQRAKP